MSSRTLRRLLTNQGTSYQSLLNKCRRETAEDYLLHTKAGIGEITKACGFAETQSFARAFKAWTGQTPSAFRKKLQDTVVRNQTAF